MYVVLICCLLPLVLPAVGHAQGEPVCTPGVVNYIVVGIAGRTGTAYTAKEKSSLEQHLPDGSMIRGYMHTTQARSSTGKTHTELGGFCFLNKEGKPTLDIDVLVHDPEARTTESWRIGGRFITEKIARIHHIPPPRPAKKLTPEELAARRQEGEDRQRSRVEVKSEDLGNRIIAGLQAHGRRTTRTIPAGEEGNELPLVVVTENWTSNELGIELMRVVDDPRTGRRKWEIEEISRTEPDAALFSPPADYKVVEDKTQTEMNVPQL
jgi:hypothetical protein